MGDVKAVKPPKTPSKPRTRHPNADGVAVQRKSNQERPRQGRKKMMIVAVVLVLLIATTASIYYFIVPRVELNLKTSYYQGSLNSIYVNTKISNVGTIDLRDVSVNISVYHLKSNNEVASKIENVSILKHWSEREIKINFIGNQYDNYMITISVYFRSNTKIFSKTFSHTTNEEYMSQSFEDMVSELGG